MATIKACRGFNAKSDIATLRDAIEGLNTDKHADSIDKLIMLATERSWDQRGEIWTGYKRIHDEDPKEALTKKLRGSNICLGLLALFGPAAERDAEWFYSAMKGLGTDEKLLIELTATRTSRQLKAIASAYERLYGKDLAGDVAGEVGGCLGKMLIKLLTVPRSDAVLPEERASAMAQQLYDAGKGKWGTDEGVFVDILTSESRGTLKSVFSIYLSKFGQDIISVIDDEFGGQAEAGLKFLVRAVLSTPQVFADAINEAVRGLGTDERALIRYICARADMDLEDIKKAFEQKYKTPLTDRVKADDGTEFGKLLVAAIH
ncbi:hypothetical protein CBR_g29793 [Chara braunii]|uniref:Annexin n=1 Tax=Chara braunii TaxID=69332 RepID=A0A388LBI0_CHABU|nr:hypothetical protein CBR_g29793 [Chara braunii]|eukprot:GBG79644.1 hypothetical protein CBR_g29793 [Chara braunii]